MVFQFVTNFINSLIIKQKGESQNGCYKRKQSMPNCLKNEDFLPSNTHTYAFISGVRNVNFSENLAYFVFLLPPF